jgi:hypothetical protein
VNNSTHLLARHFKSIHFKRSESTVEYPHTSERNLFIQTRRKIVGKKEEQQSLKFKKQTNVHHLVVGLINNGYCLVM